ncbi:hypothetical protein BJP25_05490 [Actinokineospora bangkokensis]|uniref:Uncharacterized protein n=1 Tax=Actinokineospora bangkokensis TaxID=1193682 RepID=A0A1Q9LBX5_9PSEU|nr:hypothetical protein BJP25_05490 [Actinokineospora bangkokensis]
MRLLDSLTNLRQPLFRLFEMVGSGALVLDGGVEVDREELVAAVVDQVGLVESGSVRLEVEENRMLLPEEVAELVQSYKAGATQAELARRFGVHDQTVGRHLKRVGVRLRPVRVFDEAQERRVVKLYVEEGMVMQAIARVMGVSYSAVRNVLIRYGVKRRPASPQ